jgi:hypothetical protein
LTVISEDTIIENKLAYTNEMHYITFLSYA